MTEKELHGMWNYYLMLESDLDNTSRYIEPSGQKNIHSFEFAKLLILACTEVESVFKAICAEIDANANADDIRDYNRIILSRYPKIVETTVHINRLGENIEPFREWKKSKVASPSWWGAYNRVKHNRGSNFKDATYINAAKAISALYILIFYLSEITSIKFRSQESRYIDSEYANGHIIFNLSKKLPDFEES